MKRNDLQGLRGLAIVNVLLFHFFPLAVPNGYVGVDLFFVLSGFLMTLIFGSKIMNSKSIALFYYRRVKRILPLYVAVIVTVFVSMFFILPPTFRDLNKTTATQAALLVSNLPKPSSENDYFVQLEQAVDLFTHTWSLSVEMQFYLLAPFLFLLFSFRSPLSNAFFLSIWLSSLSYHLLADSHSSFNSVFCRIWQFQVGVAAFYLGQTLSQERKTGTGDQEALLEQVELDDMENGVPINSRKITFFLWIYWTSLLVLLLCCFFPFPVDKRILRPSVTLLSSLLIVFGAHVEHNPLSSRILVYLGDISYSLYLLHWPMYVWVRYYYKDDLLAYSLIVLAAILTAVCITETFEKWYQTLEIKSTVVLLTFIYGTLAAALLRPEKAVKINQEYDRLEYPNLIIHDCIPNNTEHGFCSFLGTTGENKMLVLGNSYAANMAPLVRDAFSRLAGNISKYSNSYCEVLLVNTEDKKCKKSYDQYLKIARGFQPDILIILSRTMKGESPIANDTLDGDDLWLEMKKTLEEYEKLTAKRIYVLNSVPRVNSNHIRMLNSFIQKNSLEGADFGVKQTFHFGQRRINAAALTCKKCQVFNFNSVFIGENGTVNFYDPTTKLSYFTSGVHLTASGLEAVRPVFDGLAKSFEKQLDKRPF